MGEDDWLKQVPMGAREVFGCPNAAQCFSGDCTAAWCCEPGQCMREEYEAREREAAAPPKGEKR